MFGMTDENMRECGLQGATPFDETSTIELTLTDLQKVSGGMDIFEKVGLGILSGTGVGLISKGVHYLCTRPSGGSGAAISSSTRELSYGRGGLTRSQILDTGKFRPGQPGRMAQKLEKLVEDGVEDGILEDIPE